METVSYLLCTLCLQEKQNYIPDELGRDAQSVAAFQRKHANFESDLITLESQVSHCFDPFNYKCFNVNLVSLSLSFHTSVIYSLN